MKKAKQTLTAALAATLATGVVGSVASAAPIDDLYKAAYNAMVKAQTEKTQTAINEARVAINALPKELDGAKGEFSKQVDAVQQPIYTQIIALIEKGQKEAKQETVNEGRKLLVGVEEAYAKTWSSNLDTIQQTIVKNATDAIATAAKSQKAEDIAAAKALVAELKTAENADVKKAVEGLEKDLVEKINIYVEKVEFTNATTIQVTFSKDLDKNTVGKEDFTVKSGALKVNVTDAKLVEGKKNVVEITLSNKLEDKKEYKITVSGVKDAKGVSLKDTTLDLKYDKKEIASVKFDNTKVARKANVRDSLTVLDENGRNITKEAKLSFECTEDKNIISKDGIISSTAKIGKEVAIRVYSGDKLLVEEKVTICENTAQTILGFTVGAVDSSSNLADITPNNKIKLQTSTILTVFYKNALNEEKKVEGTGLKKLESLNTDIVKIMNGKLYGLKEGVATLRIQYGDIDETISVEVTKSNIDVATLKLSTDQIIVANSNVTKQMTFTLTDSSTGNVVTKSGVPVVEYWNPDTSKWENASSRDAIKATNKGVIEVNGSKFRSKNGDISARLTVTYNGVKYEAPFTVSVVDAGERVDSFELVAVREDNNKEITSVDQNYEHEATLKVYALDENGNRVSDRFSSTTTVYVDGVKNTKIAVGTKFDSLTLKEGDHTFEVKVERKGQTYTTNSITLTTSNSDSTSRYINVDEDLAINDTLNMMFTEWIYGDQDGTTFEAIDADVTSHAGFKVQDTTTGAALRFDLGDLVKEAKDNVNRFSEIKFVSAGTFKIRVNSVRVKVADEDGNISNKVIPVGREYTIEVK